MLVSNVKSWFDQLITQNKQQPTYAHLLTGQHTHAHTHTFVTPQKQLSSESQPAPFFPPLANNTLAFL